MKIPIKKQNAQNAHISSYVVSTCEVNRSNEHRKSVIDKKGIDMSQVIATKKPKPLSNKAFRLALDLAGTPKEEIELLVSNAIDRGAVTKSSSGKLDVLRNAFPEFAELEAKLHTWFEANREEIDAVLSSNGFEKAKKISVNVAK